MSILKLENIVKTYDKYVAVDHVSFELPKGCLFGLLGPNGAGKTSLIRIITTITKADEGQVWFDGEPLSDYHPSEIGYMPEERGLYKKMKVGEHLMYLARLKGLTKNEAKSGIEFWFERFEITDWWSKRVETLSKGMQQKIQFIATVLHNPKLMILDEPFSGLDPINTNLIKSIIFDLHQQGTSIIFSTHRMEQVEEICEQIVLINKGKVLLEGEVAAVRERYKEHLYSVKYEGSLPENLDALGQIIENKPNYLLIRKHESADAHQLVAKFLEGDRRMLAFQEELPSLNEIFIKVVGETEDQDE